MRRVSANGKTRRNCLWRGKLPQKEAMFPPGEAIFPQNMTIWHQFIAMFPLFISISPDLQECLSQREGTPSEIGATICLWRGKLPQKEEMLSYFEEMLSVFEAIPA
jgi:hypothetical protein